MFSTLNTTSHYLSPRFAMAATRRRAKKAPLKRARRKWRMGDADIKRTEIDEGMGCAECACLCHAKSGNPFDFAPGIIGLETAEAMTFSLVPLKPVLEVPAFLVSSGGHQREDVGSDGVEDVLQVITKFWADIVSEDEIGE